MSALTGFLAVGNSTRPIPSQFSRALERLKQARVGEVEAWAEILAAITNGDSTEEMDLIAENGALPFLAAEAEGPRYLSIKQVAARVPYAVKTLRNLVLSGELTQGKHYFKRRGRLMFSWSAIQEWVEEREAAQPEPIALVRSRRHGRSS